MEIHHWADLEAFKRWYKDTTGDDGVSVTHPWPYHENKYVKESYATFPIDFDGRDFVKPGQTIAYDGSAWYVIRPSTLEKFYIPEDAKIQTEKS